MPTKKERMEALEKEQVEWGDNTDPMDLFTAIMVLSQEEEDPRDFLQSSLYSELLQATQSNPDKAHAAILKMLELDDKIQELDENDG